MSMILFKTDAPTTVRMMAGNTLEQWRQVRRDWQDASAQDLLERTATLPGNARLTRLNHEVILLADRLRTDVDLISPEELPSRDQPVVDASVMEPALDQDLIESLAAEIGQRIERTDVGWTLTLRSDQGLAPSIRLTSWGVHVAIVLVDWAPLARSDVVRQALAEFHGQAQTYLQMARVEWSPSGVLVASGCVTGYIARELGSAIEAVAAAHQLLAAETTALTESVLATNYLARRFQQPSIAATRDSVEGRPHEGTTRQQPHVHS